MTAFEFADRRFDAEHFSTHAGVFECAVQVRADDARAAHPSRRQRRAAQRGEVYVAIEGRDAEMNLVSAERHAAGCRRSHRLARFSRLNTCRRKEPESVTDPAR